MRTIGTALFCPDHRLPLRVTDADLRCPVGCAWPIVRGIPRFVPPSTYAAGFGAQWRRYRTAELDSVTGRHDSRDRLERCLGGPLSLLRDKTVLECGAGAGRFTELLADTCAMLVSLDLSAAVEANAVTCAGKRYLLLQADINRSPLRFHAFDVVLCLGVIQHTPDPETAITNLARHVKPGGWLVLDHYAAASSWWRRLGQNLTLEVPLRAILKRISRARPDLALILCERLTAVCDPIRKRTVRHRWLDRFVGRLFPSACYYAEYPDADSRTVYAWNQLDTHDKLTDWYKHRRSAEQIREHLKRIGLTEIVCGYAGNGIEARGRVGPELGVPAEVDRCADTR